MLAGINGVGKTTLLNLLMRMLLGPLDRPKGERELSRVSKRKLVEDKDFSFFRDRVPEGDSLDATAALEFSIGNHSVKLVRSLRTMKLTTVAIDREPFEPDDERYCEEMAKLAGLASGYEFHVVVRYLQFFTEERLPILWSTATQFEFFKLLLLDRKTSKNLSDTFALVQKLDSDFRNKDYQLKPKEKEFEKAKLATSQASGAGDLDKRIADARLAHEAALNAHAAQVKAFDDLQTRARSFDEKFYAAEIALSQRESELQNADAAFIGQALPTADDKAKFLMAGLGAGQGCFVCGRRHRSQVASIADELKNGQCFVCHHPLASRGKGAAVKPLASAKVRALEESVDAVRAELTAITAQREALQTEFARVIEARRRAAVHQAETSRTLAALEAQKPVPVPSELEADLKAQRATLDAMDKDRKAAAKKYRDLVAVGREQMEGFKEEFRSKLTSYAEAFLQETVAVHFDQLDKVPIATGVGDVVMPSFSISMTSSTHAVPQKRVTSDSVSESQKEFLDLAYRMALLDMVCSDGATTLVIETPEASLDSWFMLRAAELMRRFAPTGSRPVRNLIATSNINGTAMIPGLLGRLDAEGKWTSAAANDAQFVNLLRLTALSKTLKDAAARTLIEEEVRRLDV